MSWTRFFPFVMDLDVVNEWTINPWLFVWRAGNTHMKSKQDGQSSDVYVPLYAR